jgi:hypothetical protein
LNTHYTIRNIRKVVKKMDHDAYEDARWTAIMKDSNRVEPCEECGAPYIEDRLMCPRCLEKALGEPLGM